MGETLHFSPSRLYFWADRKISSTSQTAAPSQQRDQGAGVHRDIKQVRAPRMKAPTSFAFDHHGREMLRGRLELNAHFEWFAVKTNSGPRAHSRHTSRIFPPTCYAPVSPSSCPAMTSRSSRSNSGNDVVARPRFDRSMTHAEVLCRSRVSACRLAFASRPSAVMPAPPVRAAEVTLRLARAEKR
jgi:hypothetical protein